MLRDGYTPAEVEEALQDSGLLPAPAASGYAAPGAAGYAAARTAGYAAPSTAGYAPHPAGRPGQPFTPWFPQATGKEAYLLGFLAYIPVPFLGSLVAGAAMALAYRGQRHKSALAAENARRAANWGLTYVLATVVVLVATALGGLAANRAGGSDGPLAVLALLLPLGIAHLMVTIRGVVLAGRGEVFRNPIAIPFLRAGR